MSSERQQINSNAGIHHTLSRQILGTESSARRVIEWLAEGQEPVVWRFKERADDMRSAWLYVKKRGHVPNGHPWQGLYAAPVSEAKAQVYEPLVCDYCNAETQDPWHGSGMLNGVESRHIHACSQCRNLLPTTKAQCVVMPAELDRAFITSESCDGVYRVAIQSETLKEMQAIHNWLARLNAAHVQRVSVPASAFASRAITHYEAALLAAFPSGSSGEVFNQWNEARRVLAAAPAAPAADAGHVFYGMDGNHP